MSALPLVSRRALGDVLAWRPTGPVSVGRYCADVQAVAGWLAPLGRWIINLCEDRYHYAVVLGACAVSGRVSLQPASQSAQTLQTLAATHEGAVAVVDTAQTLAVPTRRLALPDGLPEADRIPEVDGAQTVAILFTSGSTGAPQPHAKTWGRLVANGAAESQALGLWEQPHVLVGTVPAQHSYGFESTFLLALHGGCSFWSGKPFYPADLVQALDSVPTPRMVVTTPYHLASIAASGLQLPAVQRWLSATAPLDVALAQRVEAATGAPVYEIYGSTESSQLATRRTTASPQWQLMPGVELQQQGDTTWACGGHVEGRVPLADRIAIEADGRFTLQGRHADMVNLAGKRSSLAYLNYQLCGIDGVCDGVFFLPQGDGVGSVGRLVAFVVAPQRTRAELVAALRERIDPLFMPRPLVRIERLPRNATGKVERAVLEQLHAQHVQRAGAPAGERRNAG